MTDSPDENIPANDAPTDGLDVIISLKAQPERTDVPSNQEDSEEREPEFEWKSLRFLNLAIQQSHFPLVPELIVRNHGEEPLSGLSCTIAVEPESFASEKSFPIEDVRPGRQVALRNLSPSPDFDKLLSLVEPIHGSIRLSVRSGDSILFEEERPLEIYAPDQWTGPDVLPELTAAFVMPNFPDSQELVKSVSEELRKATGDASVDGYQSGKGRAYEILQACYRALYRVGIRYAMHVASFAEAGQKVRLPEAVLRDRIGTCIETTLLLASLAEQCGLHPVVMVVQGHAYLGCHLTDSHFPDPATDDLQTVRKRVADDEFTMVETTCLTKPDVTFTQAETIAKNDQLDNDAEFVCAIDVQRARYSGVRPLPLRSVAGGSFVFEEPPAVPDELREEGTRELREAVDLSTLDRAVRTPGDRLGRWQQKLLDLSTRNRLLNVREGKFAIPLLCPEVGEMEDFLAAGKPLVVGPISRLLGSVDVNEIRSKDFSDLETPLQSLLKGELKQRRLWSFLGEKELARSLTSLYRESRTDLEEGGVNTLFLALGFLEWTTHARTALRYHAPILLVPVRMDRGAVADGVKIVRIDEDTVVNETLLELLRSEFRIEIPGLSPLPTDASGVDVPLVLDIFRQAVKDREGWEVRPVAVLGRFSFGKFVMWNDLTARKDELARNPLVHHLMFGGGVYDDGVETFPEEEVSSRIDPSNLFCPMSADSSQLAAVLYSAMGKSFVLHGPPGTGKSQTITNIIAHNLALGRRVLFVSEKKAALDVVHRRLSSIGLRPFCLELHSNKAGKADVMRQFDEALSVADVREPADWTRETQELQALRSELDGHVRELHREFPNGLTAYRCFSWLLNHPEDPEFAWSLRDPATQTREELDRLRHIVGDLSSAFTRAPDSARGVLDWLSDATPDWSPVWERKALAAARRLRASADALSATATPVAESFGVPAEAMSGGIAALAWLAQAATGAATGPAPAIPDSFGSMARLGGWNLAAVLSSDGVDFGKRFEEVRAASALLRVFKQKSFLDDARRFREDKAMKVPMEEAIRAVPDIRASAESARKLRESGAADPFLAAWKAFSDARMAFEDAVPGCGTDVDAGTLLRRASDLLRLGSALRDALACRAAEAASRAAGLGAFADRVAAGKTAPADLPDFFETAARRSMLDAILERSPLLCNFTGARQEDRIRRFAELDDRYLSLSRQMVFARLAARLPGSGTGNRPDGTELGILRRECAKTSRQKPIRLLLEQTPTLVPMLKPCFLMSPLSVAQYLPPGSAEFDLVVFDEASQIPVWDAIGVLARAKQHVIVGDPKQMPPTDFFRKGDDDSDDPAAEDEVEDMESILDECIASGMFSSHLDWHYRSRHESLIAFSNHYYYDERLSTFPSAVASDRLGVRFQFVRDGVYDRRKSRTNGKEAKALVDYVVAHVLAEKTARRSVGIVTFSEAQRNLIERLLDEERCRNARLDAILAEESDEPLFVKNLENVQGDERDVILFSVGYAPDAEGKFTMNFGPLNRQGGERRLNVAITRAKEQVVVFSSIRGSQIDLLKTSAVGAAHLRYFLEYAEKGLGVPVQPPSEAAGEGLAAAVGAFLESRGWTIDRNLGTSGCRIDLAVRHPEREGECLLGILCDGPGYAAQTDTRDREHLRASVLRGMGWRLVHVWTVDWALDRRRAEERLLSELAEAKAAPPPAPPEPAAVPEPSVSPAIGTEETSPAERVASKRKPYATWIGATPLPQAVFYEAETLPVIRGQIEEILSVEAPIRETLLRRRIARAWGFSHVGQGISDVVARSIPPEAKITGNGESRVLWDEEQEPGDWHDWRVAEKPDERRELADFPPEEIANAMYEVLMGFKTQSCPLRDLYRETLKGLGFATLTDKTRPFLDAALAVLRKQGKV